MDFSKLRSAVQARLDVVADRELREQDPVAHLEKLRSVAAILDGIIAELPTDIDPLLHHYLERQSYLKALDWLDRASREQV